MKKRITALLLSVTVAFACFAGMPTAVAVNGAESHLIKTDSKTYKITSPDGNVAMDFFVNSDSRLAYDVEKTSVETTYETLTVGDVDSDEKITVSDVVGMRMVIMNGTSDKRADVLCDLDKDGKITVSDVVALRKLIMSGDKPDTVEFPTTEQSGEAEVFVSQSDLGMVIDTIDYATRAVIKDVSVSEIYRTYAHNGNQSEITDNCMEAVFTITSFSYTYYVDVRVYNNGVAFRYRMPSTGAARTISEESTTFALRSDLETAWYGVNNQDYESVPGSFNPAVASADHIDAPIIAKIKDNGGYISVQEAGVTDSYVGTNLVAKGGCTYKVANTWDSANENNSFSVTGDVTTGWRLVNFASDLDGIVNNYNVYNVNEEPDSELYDDTSWIEPGRSTWSWLTDYGATLGTADASYTYTENAAKLGFEYNLIDEGYTAWNDYQNELKALGEYGESLNVKQILWAQVSTNGRGFKMTNISEAESYLDFLKSSHFYGGKIDFWWSENSSDRTNKNNTALQEEILKMAAERQLIVDFHGCNKPAGLDATYPNELTREAIRGLENVGNAQNTSYATQSSWLTNQLFTRYLSGHADWTPACNTAMQIASLICIDSPYNVIATNPEDILANDAVELIKSIPTVWDKTKVLSGSEVGEAAIYAKESNGNWFLGGIMNKSTENTQVKLDEFLGSGDYSMELWVDDGTGAKTKSVKTVTKYDILDLGSFTAGTGFAARFSKLTLNQYGGEILFGNKLEMSAVSTDSVIKYTTDGSDPMTSATALTYTEPVQLTESCRLTAAVASGDGAGTTVSAKFNIVGYHTVNENIDYNSKKTSADLSFTSNFDCDIYYTSDGSEATVNSTKYIAPFAIGESSTVNYLAVPRDGSENVVGSFYVFINPAEIAVPDLYLGSGYVDAKTDWGSVKIDKDLNGDTITLGGTTSSNGVAYEHGFGLNAKGYLVYNIPEGATQFVGVVGIDDRTWDSNDGAQASSTLSVEFDGTEAYSTPVFRRGDAYNVIVDIPDGAKQIKLVIGDAGNGITCDNVSMGNAGWILGNKEANKVTHAVDESHTGYSTVTLSANFNGTIYYTVDGNEPTTDSDVYSAALNLTESCTIKILGVVDGTDERITDSFDVTVTPFELIPDAYLGTDYISATTGWAGDPASVDKNTKGNKISIGGVEYLHGISTNAVGTFVYNIPTGAAKFIGIFGVDDCASANVNDGNKASVTCTITFDTASSPAYSSAVIKPNGFDTINIDVPEGATKITITFGDAGDGITCDNASMGNAGWILAK